jgi:diguanylate cyclase (GGDEF)-like protein
VSEKKDIDSFPGSHDWISVLGLRDSGDAYWGNIRAWQIGVIAERAIARFGFSIIGGGITVAALFGTSAAWIGWAWYALILAVSGFLAAPHIRRKNSHLLSATRSELNGSAFGIVLASLSWSALPIALGLNGDPSHALIAWTGGTAMMAGATFTFSSVPLFTSILIATLGFALAAMMFMLAMPFIGVIALFYTVGLIAACLKIGRTAILHKVNEFVLQEKSEVVSLLLREYEDSGGDWMWQTDASRCLTHVSPRFAIALGVEPQALEAKPLLQILAGDAWEAGNFSSGLRDLSEKLKNRESFSDLILPVQIGGSTHWWELSASPRFDDNGSFIGFRGVGSDVSEAYRTADKINRMARYDMLTGLPNRMLVNETLGTAMAEADRWRTRCGFMMIDLDRFKAVNDTLGHPIGDRLLTRVSERLRSVMSDNELCGRLGGDEFAVVVKDANDPQRLARLARDIIDTLSQPYEIDQYTIYIGASVGTAIGPRDGRSVEMLIRSADLALYKSKDQGGGAYNSYEPQFHAHAEERRVVEIALRKALDRKEFELHYQPVVNAQSGIIESFEALLRWNNPDLGVVSPAKFIPIAEEARLIGAIGEWVLRTACSEAARWPSTIRVAVNVSAEQLHDPQFATTVVSALSHAGLPPHRLELEVTESVFMREGTKAIAVLDQILALGVRLALDDFGTGYSSLGYLSKTKFSTIKVDRSFVQGAAKNLPESLAIIRAVVALADSLGMTTTAEGVETDDECEMIKGLGCRKIQGYLFGRPMPAAEARRVITSDKQARAA